MQLPVHDMTSPPGPSRIVIRSALPGLSLIALFAAGLPGPAAAQRVYRDYEDGTRRALTDEDIRRLSIEQNRQRYEAAPEDVFDGREWPDSPRGPGGDDDEEEDSDRAGSDDDEDDDGGRDNDAGFEDDEIFEPRDRDDRADWNEGRLTDPLPQPGTHRDTAEGQTTDRTASDSAAVPDPEPPAITSPSAPPAGQPPPAGWKPTMGKVVR